MISRTVLTLTASSLAALPGSVLAQSTMSYDIGQYEYAQPLPELDDDVVTESIVTKPEPTHAEQAPVTPVFVARPRIQSIDPSDPEHYTYDTPPNEPASAVASAVRTIPARAPAYVGQGAEPAAVASRPIYHEERAQPALLPDGYPAGYAGAPTYLPVGAQVVTFDRNVWLDECRSRLDTYENDSDRGKIIGALIGGAVGGVLGNRVAGRGNRTEGTLIGAGAGALAGMAAGDAIEDRNRPRSDSYEQCQAYLDSYMQNATASAGAVRYTQPGPYMLVPVTVLVPQRVVYREVTPVD